MTTLEKMAALEKLQEYSGKLLHLKTQLYWFTSFHGHWDKKPGQVYLILGADPPIESHSTAPPNYSFRRHDVATEHVMVTEDHPVTTPTASVLLLIDDQQLWASVCVQDIEVILPEDADTSEEVINESINEAT
jgi:hypothetical protein